MNNTLNKDTGKLRSYPIFHLEQEEPRYTFFEVSDNKVTIKINTMKKSSREDQNWVKFLLLERLTLSVSTPTYLGFPVVNAYMFSAQKLGQRKKLTNVSNSLPFKTGKFGNKEFTYFIHELEELMERNNISLPKEHVSESLKRLYFSPSERTKNPLHSNSFKEILNFYLHPLLMHVQKAEDDVIKELPCSTARTFEDLVSVLKITTNELKLWLKEKYTKNTLTSTHLLFLTICKSWKEKELLEILELVDYLFSKIEPSNRNLFSKDDFSNHSALTGLMPKVDPKMIINEITEVGEKIIKTGRGNRIQMPTQNVLYYWSKNYRKTKPLKDKLKGLSDTVVLDYLITHIDTLSSDEPENKDSLVERINNLKLIKNPVSDLEVPEIYENLLSVVSKEGNYVLRTSPFLKKNYFLYNLVKGVGTPVSRSNEIVSLINPWENAISLMEKVDSYIVTMFTRRKIDFNLEIAHQLYNLLIKLNSSSLYPHLKGKVPTHVVSLIPTKMDFAFAVTLLCNKVTYKEIVTNVLIDGIFSLPKDWVLDIYEISQVYEESGKKDNLFDDLLDF